MGVVNLDENIKFQWASFVGLVLVMLQFLIYFIFLTPFYPSEIPVIGYKFTQLISVFIFSWSFPMLIPSWLNEKKPHVSINKTIWYAAIASYIGYAGIGMLAALSIPNLHADNVLKRLSGDNIFILTRIGSYFFALLIIAPGIPGFYF
jgi:amino acid permease